MHIHVRFLQNSLKQRKLKDGEYNEQYKKGNEKTVVHRTMHQKKQLSCDAIFFKQQARFDAKCCTKTLCM
jgi:hypothetical protein